MSKIVSEVMILRLILKIIFYNLVLKKIEMHRLAHENIDIDM